MTPPSTETNELKALHAATLPLKITGIVFWGMVLVGVVASWLLLKDFRDDLVEKNNDQLQAMTLQISQLLTQHPGAPLYQFKDRIDFQRTAANLDALFVTIGAEQLILGSFHSECDIRAQNFALARADENGVLFSSTDHWLLLCLPNIDSAVFHYRKNILVAMGLLFFTFGFVLQAILKRILTAPISHMLESASKIYHGSTETRFDDKRDDEFGFLARFINQALDATAKKSRELVEAEQANSAKSMFLANMSHEIRTPLTAVLGFAENLLEEKQSERDRRASLNRILRNGQHLMQIINDVLDISKIEANQLSVEMLDTPLLQIINDVDSLIGDRIRSKGLTLSLQHEFPLPKYIVSDPTRLTQILLNLCANGEKFTERGGIELSVRYLQHSDIVEIKVKDTGIGMTEDELSRLFKPFSQADQSTTRKFGGTGLGLHISRQLARMLGGDLTCVSRKGFGTEFTLTVRAHVPPNAETVNDLSAQPTSLTSPQAVAVPRLKGAVLLAEDHPDNQLLISSHVRRTGAEITIVDNGQRAIDALRVEDFDLILLDMQMPIMDGLDTLRWLRSRGYTTPIAMLTANAIKAERQRCLDLGANTFLTKPINKKAFYGCLAQYLVPASGNATTTPDGDDEEIIAGVRERFISELPSKLVELEAALDKHDWKTLRKELHHLKGLGGGLGFPKITELCQELECEPTDTVRIKLRELINYFSQLIKENFDKTATETAKQD